MTIATAPRPERATTSFHARLTKARAAKNSRASREELLATLAQAIQDRPEAQRTVITTFAERSIPTPHLRAYIRAIAGKSLKAIAKAHCMGCVCWQRKEVRLCTNPACELWRFRPYQ